MTRLKNCLLIFAVLLIACKKNQNAELGLQTEQLAKFNEIISLKTSEDRKISFQMLSNTEKVDFWKFRVVSFLKTTDELSKKKLLTEMVNNLTPNVYDQSSNEHEIFVGVKLPNWMKRAKEVFNGREILDLFYVLQRETIYQDTILEGNDKKSNDNTTMMMIALADCMCNLGSGFTCPKTTTHVGTDGVWQETTYGSCSNEGNGCKQDNWGCGFAGLFYCNGNKCTY